MSAPEFMTTHEVAEYLRIRERKVYELVRQRRIPCSRATGKWLFPKRLVDLWVLRHVEGADGLRPTGERPPVIAGSHDPLLAWAARETGSELGVMFNGSVEGLASFIERKALLCGLHVLDRESTDYNVTLVAQALAGSEHVMVEWAWREQGLIVAPGNPRGIRGPRDLARADVTVVGRQQGAGSRLLLEYLLAQQDLQVSDVVFTETPARDETDVAMAVLGDSADTGLGIAAVARPFQLDFVPLHRERYDLVVDRRDYFEQPLQRLFEFARTPRFARRAAELGGYDISTLGRVVLNA